MLVQGPRSTDGLLRFPGGALDAHSHDEPDRIDVRYRAPANEQDQGVWNPKCMRDDGVQIDGERVEGLAQAKRCSSSPRDSSGDEVCRWNQSCQRRRLNRPSSTTFGNNSNPLAGKYNPF